MDIGSIIQLTKCGCWRGSLGLLNHANEPNTVFGGRQMLCGANKLNMACDAERSGGRRRGGITAAALLEGCSNQCRISARLISDAEDSEGGREHEGQSQVNAHFLRS